MNMHNKETIRKQNNLENYYWEGTLLEIRTYPDPILKVIASPVETFDQNLEQLCFDMLFTMYHARGIGLAAPQVGLSKRFFVMDIDYDRTEEKLPDGTTYYQPTEFNPRILINPVIRDRQGEIVFREGCLSLPKIYDDVTRYYSCCVDYQDIKGEKHTLEANDLLSICIQHENDHLDGIVFLERLSPLKRELYIKKMLKRQKKSPSKHPEQSRQSPLK